MFENILIHSQSRVHSLTLRLISHSHICTFRHRNLCNFIARTHSRTILLSCTHSLCTSSLTLIYPNSQLCAQSASQICTSTFTHSRTQSFTHSIAPLPPATNLYTSSSSFTLPFVLRHYQAFTRNQANCTHSVTVTNIHFRNTRVCSCISILTCTHAHAHSFVHSIFPTHSFTRLRSLIHLFSHSDSLNRLRTHAHACTHLLIRLTGTHAYWSQHTGSQFSVYTCMYAHVDYILVLTQPFTHSRHISAHSLTATYAHTGVCRIVCTLTWTHSPSHSFIHSFIHSLPHSCLYMPIHITRMRNFDCTPSTIPFENVPLFVWNHNRLQFRHVSPCELKT